jgi:hypothetical protein
MKHDGNLARGFWERLPHLQDVTQEGIFFFASGYGGFLDMILLTAASVSHPN